MEIKYTQTARNLAFKLYKFYCFKLLYVSLSTAWLIIKLFSLLLMSDSDSTSKSAISDTSDSVILSAAAKPGSGGSQTESSILFMWSVRCLRILLGGGGCGESKSQAGFSSPNNDSNSSLSQTTFSSVTNCSIISAGRNSSSGELSIVFASE